ncbi:MAG: cytochrome c oxidase subunit I [Bacillota bacterium]|nr:MAG: cytochrome c oxidase subunit I [Bacillota bacterium]
MAHGGARAVTTAGQHVHAGHHHEPRSFWRRYVFSTDHKVIGIQFLVTSLLMAAVGGFLAMLMRLQLGWPGREWPLLEAIMPNAFKGGKMNPDFFYGAVTMHGTIMVFFFLTTALSGGFANFLIPLQIGARDMAFPVLNMISYWLFPVAIIFAVASFFVEGGAPGTGWTAYTPLSVREPVGQTLWLISVFILMLAFLAGGINYITTTLNMRTKGMSMSRLPLTVWALFLTALVGLFAFPPLMAAVLMLLFDRLGGTSFFIPDGGGDPILYQHLFWFFGHPEVYIVILPAMGIVSEVLATSVRKPIFGYRYMVGSMVAISTLSFLVWGHHMFASGMSPDLGTIFMATTLAIGIPSAVKVFSWLATIYRGKMRFTSAALFAVGFVSLFITGGITGIVLGNPSTDLYFHDTYMVVGHFHLVMGAAALFGLFAGIYHWFPKMFGRMMNERLGKIHFALTFLGIYGTFFPMHFLGTAGMPRRIYDWHAYSFLQDMDLLNVVISVSAFVVGAAQLIFAYNFFYSMFRGPKAERNPWQANTLEWWAPSPPPHGNWDETEPVVYRWPYEYSAKDAPPGTDHIPQWVPQPAAEPAGAGSRGR